MLIDKLLVQRTEGREIKPLRYPDDRFNGFVIQDIEGRYFVPKIEVGGGFKEYRRYWRAWRELMRRQFGKEFDPAAIKNQNIVYWE